MKLYYRLTEVMAGSPGCQSTFHQRPRCRPRDLNVDLSISPKPLEMKMPTELMAGSSGCNSTSMNDHAKRRSQNITLAIGFVNCCIAVYLSAILRKYLKYSPRVR